MGKGSRGDAGSLRPLLSGKEAPSTNSGSPVVGPEQDTALRRIRPSAGYGPKTLTLNLKP